jgi:hypothetical protein
LKKRIQEFLLGSGVPFFLMIYALLPTVKNDGGILASTFFLLVFILRSIYQSYAYQSIDKRVIVYIGGSLIGVVISYYSVWYDTWIISLTSLIILAPILMAIYRRKRKVDHDLNLILNLTLYVIAPISFLLSVFILTLFADNNIDKLFFTEKQYVTFIVFSIVIFTALYSISFSYFFYNFLLQRSSSKYTLLKLSLVIIILLVLPDLIISGLAYDFYLGIFDECEYRLLDRYYYSFSSHFLTPVNSVGERIEKHLLSTDLGLSIYIIHMIMIRFIDVSIIAAISNFLPKPKF